MKSDKDTLCGGKNSEPTKYESFMVIGEYINNYQRYEKNRKASIE